MSALCAYCWLGTPSSRRAGGLRVHLDTTNWSYGLLESEFSLRGLQHAHEAIRGETLNKPAFRKRLLESGWTEPTGRRETDTRFRPAELYRLKEEHARER